MATFAHELEFGVLSRLDPKEQIFVIKGSDAIGVDIIRLYMAVKKATGASSEKITSIKACIDAMEVQQQSGVIIRDAPCRTAVLVARDWKEINAISRANKWLMGNNYAISEEYKIHFITQTAQCRSYPINTPAFFSRTWWENPNLSAADADEIKQRFQNIIK